MTRREIVNQVKAVIKDFLPDATVEVYRLDDYSIGMDIVSDHYGDLNIPERVIKLTELFRKANVFQDKVLAMCPVDYAMYNERRARDTKNS